MTEPTAEQVDEILMELGFGEHRHARPTGVVALRTALARVRIEGYAAGRDEGLEAAADVAEGYDDDEIAYDIRALRGRT